MRISQILSLAALSTAFVIPAEEVLAEIAIEDNHRGNSIYDDVVASKDDILESFKQHFEDVTETTSNGWNKVSSKDQNALDEAFGAASEVASNVNDKIHETAFDAQAWLDSEMTSFAETFDDPHHGPPPHDGPPHHGPPHHGPDHGRPHHPPHHHEPNKTVYQLIAGSKYTTKLAKLINEFPDLVKTLNSTKANYTIFAPTDKAFEKIPEHHHKPSKEFLEALLSYHVVPDFYPAGRVLVSHTAPTLLKSKHLGAEPLPQRLSFHIGLRGLTVNFYSRVVAINIFGTNGVIHGIDSILIPPPSVIKIIDLLPGEFSTLELGLGKTGLLEKLNTTDHKGGTFFAPSNFAFKKLGPRINAFLFSSYGQKYLKALLEYHVVPDNTLYSDAYYKAASESQEGIPKGYFHVDLPTLLEDRHLSVDIARYGGFISIKINGFSRVAVQDGIAEDGVIHVVGDVLVPPKKIGGVMQVWEGGEMEVEELVERLEPFVGKSDL
nr:hypothetical protein B0A51_15230 [Rachicladosporium sp. CCFEE 5018]